MNIEQIMKQLDLSGHALPVVGGDVNQAYRIVDDDRPLFMKLHPGTSQSFFEAEVAGLKELGKQVRVPKVYQVGEYQRGAFLLMEWIEPGEGTPADLGHALAQLHQQTSSSFGFPENNFLGVLPQKNQENSSWSTFYIEKRLKPQIKIAQKNNHWNPQREEQFCKLKELIQQKWQNLAITPRLLHGDFWSGNVFFDKNGTPVFIDPAVSYGHREMDLAMARLFGGFRQEMFAAYESQFPLDADWSERLPVYQLYYLLAHLNMFGESYGKAVDKILNLY